MTDITKRAEEYAKEQGKNKSEYYFASEGSLKEAYEQGWKDCIEQEEWKNLYSEGLEVGMKMLRQYKEAMQKVHDELTAEIAQLKQKL